MSEDAGRGDLRLFREMLPYMHPERWLYLASMLLAPISAAMIVLQPWLLQQAIDVHISAADLEGLEQVALLYLGAIVVGIVAQTGHQLLLSYAAMRTITRVRKRVYDHTLGLAQSFFDRTRTGRLLTRATSDVESLGETLTAGAVTLYLDVLQVLGVLVAMFLLDARLTAMLLLTVPPLAFVIDQLRRRLRALYQIVRTSLADLNAFLSERLEGVEVVQLYRDEARAVAGFQQRLDTFTNATIRTNIFDAMVYAVVDGVTSVTMALMLWYGSGDLLGTALSAGTLAAFVEYVARLFRPIQEFSQKLAVLQQAGAALSKIFGLLDEDERIDGGDAVPADADGHLRIEDVRFAYGDGPQILRGIDVDLKPGSVVALVGRTGSGKTTLGKLLTRAYQGYTGRITLDGVELADLPVADVRRRIGSVQQDVQLFPGDVRFNLTLGADIADEALSAAIRLVHAEEVVARLGGLDGIIEESGRNLSAGEAQLLSFARTMAHDPPVIILDEATASVDSLTEAKIQAATGEILARKTTLVIAHRLSTIVNADEILVLDAGAVLERGTHEALLAMGGRYAHLFEQQLQTAPTGHA
jgi:ATP-binding cassette subfamily B protein